MLLFAWAVRRTEQVSVALSNYYFLFGVAMGRVIRLRATSYCSRSCFLYSAGMSYVFCRVIKFFKFLVAFFVFKAVRSVYNTDVQIMNKTCEACEA